MNHLLINNLQNAIDAINDAQYHIEQALKDCQHPDLRMACDQNQMNVDRIKCTMNHLNEYGE